MGVFLAVDNRCRAKYTRRKDDDNQNRQRYQKKISLRPGYQNKTPFSNPVKQDTPLVIFLTKYNNIKKQFVHQSARHV